MVLLIILTIGLSFLLNWLVPLIGFESDPFTVWLVSYLICFLAIIPWQLKREEQRYEGFMEREPFWNTESTMILQILAIAEKRKGYITPSDIAAHTELTIKQAIEALQKLQKQGYAELSVAQTGDIIYYFPGFK
ncbi:MarR family transcriptional regulator [Brevibacillus laterosporus]|uniref:MarR family transcriptional regulator n=1 Tax=Brevibacillus laterosporus TaxID=1465 RepID=UPI000E6C8221|nr:MarR family transcriptional regulator [Brevibacillus laterosporus]AYB40832.1 hypothetical protein D5F52_22740 [Brevibacillus laterosporus]MBM7110440.1 hypothetical protein [Brevibacillus laterosporus]